jgi:aspartate/tyrosine/aromatic aminotransferase
MSFFLALDPLPDDPIFGLTTLFNQDNRPEKVNLSVGVYTNDEGQTVVFDAVREAEKAINNQSPKKDYLPIEGNKVLIEETLKLVFGPQLCDIPRDRFFGAQAIGGTGGLRIGAEFLARSISKNVYVSDPSWPIHNLLFNRTGMNVIPYPYYDSANHNLSFTALKNCVKRMSPGSIMVLHACCHNPTGIDLTEDQWKQLSVLLLRQRIIPFFDLAYLGFGRGLDEDAFAIRQFVKDGHELFVSCSFSKNFGVYGERGGCFLALTKDPAISATLATHIKPTIRGLYSNPPLTAARLVAHILSDENLRNLWTEELKVIRKRIETTRTRFIELLSAKIPESDFSFMSQQQGMFTIFGITKPVVERLRTEFAIYLPDNGRVSIPGLNHKNMEYVTDCIAKVMRG